MKQINIGYIDLRFGSQPKNILKEIVLKYREDQSNSWLNDIPTDNVFGAGSSIPITHSFKLKGINALSCFYLCGMFLPKLFTYIWGHTSFTVIEILYNHLSDFRDYSSYRERIQWTLAQHREKNIPFILLCRYQDEDTPNLTFAHQVLNLQSSDSFMFYLSGDVDTVADALAHKINQTRE